MPFRPRSQLIVFDASAVVSAALKTDGIPERALLRAAIHDVFAQSASVASEIEGVLSRSKFAGLVSPLHPWRRMQILTPAEYLAVSQPP